MSQELCTFFENCWQAKEKQQKKEQSEAPGLRHPPRFGNPITFSDSFGHIFQYSRIFAKKWTYFPIFSGKRYICPANGVKMARILENMTSKLKKSASGEKERVRALLF
jgi:hypothetical protein